MTFPLKAIATMLVAGVSLSTAEASGGCRRSSPCTSGSTIVCCDDPCARGPLGRLFGGSRSGTAYSQMGTYEYKSVYASGDLKNDRAGDAIRDLAEKLYPTPADAKEAAIKNALLELGTSLKR